MIILEPWLFKSFYEYDPDLGFRVKSYLDLENPDLTTNRFGFNDRDYDLKKPQGFYRILILSDSFNWAGGRKGNYTQLLEDKFETYYGTHKVDIINAGYPMTHTAEQLELLKKFGLMYNPDLVVLGFFAGNDFLNASPYRKRIVLNGLYIDIDKRKWEDCSFLGIPIVPKSRLLLFLKQKFMIIRETINARRDSKKDSKKSSIGDREKGTYSEATFLNIERSRIDICSIDAYKKGKYRENLNFILNSISEMANLLEERKIDFLVAIYPDEFQVNDKMREKVISKFNLNGVFEWELPQNILKEYLNSRGIPFIDFLDDFRKKGKYQSLYKLRDTHWNELGNSLASDILFDYLVSKKGSDLHKYSLPLRQRDAVTLRE